MAVKPTPEGYHSVTPFLAVRGVAKVIDFLKATFDAEQVMRMEGPGDTVSHAEVRVGDSLVMMGEPMAGMDPVPGMLYVYVKDADATYQRALKAGATSVREPRDEFYGDRNAGVKDAAGNTWWIATHVEDVSPEEIRRRAEAQARE